MMILGIDDHGLSVAYKLLNQKDFALYSNKTSNFIS